MAGIAAGLCFLGLSLLTESEAGASTAQKRIVGFVYTETNNPAGNKLVVFKRFADGKLKKLKSSPRAARAASRASVAAPDVRSWTRRTRLSCRRAGNTCSQSTRAATASPPSEWTASGLKRVDHSVVRRHAREPRALRQRRFTSSTSPRKTANGTTGNLKGLLLLRRAACRQGLVADARQRRLRPITPPTRARSQFTPDGRVIVVN